MHTQDQDAALLAADVLKGFHPVHRNWHDSEKFGRRAAYGVEKIVVGHAGVMKDLGGKLIQLRSISPGPHHPAQIFPDYAVDHGTPGGD